MAKAPTSFVSSFPVRFAVRYFDPQRAIIVQAQLDAPTEAELRDQLASQGHVLLDMKTATGSRSQFRGKRLNVGWWCRELRTLLQAGMTVVEALETLQADRFVDSDPVRAQVHAALLKSLREGQSLSRAMHAVGAFPDVLTASVAAGERTSTLHAMLDEYLRYEETLQRLRKELVSAAIYPAMVVMLGGTIGLFLLLYVIPRFSKMYSGIRGNMSTSTEVLLAVSQAFSTHLGFVISAVFVTGGVIAWAARSGLLGRSVGALVARVGPLQRQWDHFRLARLFQSLALMFKGGYTLEEALEVCGRLGSGSKMDAGLRTARTEIARGRGVAAALSAGNLTDPVSERLLAVGERSSNFERVLQTIADRHSHALLTFVERATRIVEPVLLLLVALIVGGIVVMMYLPIFDLASSVG